MKIEKITWDYSDRFSEMVQDVVESLQKMCLFVYENPCIEEESTLESLILSNKELTEEEIREEGAKILEEE